MDPDPAGKLFLGSYELPCISMEPPVTEAVYLWHQVLGNYRIVPSRPDCVASQEHLVGHRMLDKMDQQQSSGLWGQRRAASLRLAAAGETGPASPPPGNPSNGLKTPFPCSRD